MAEYRAFRMVGNYAHKRISLDHPVYDVASPPFPQGSGYFNIEPNGKYESGFIDFNYKECTGNKGKQEWHFDYLHGESEFKGDKPPRLGRQSDKLIGSNVDYWNMEDCNYYSDLLGDGAQGVFSTRGEQTGYFVVADHRKRSISTCFYDALLDKVHWGKPCTFRNEGQKANYTPVSGLTFRYKVQCQATRDGAVIDALENSMTVVPLFSCGLFVTRGRDNDPIYYVELIALSNTMAAGSNGCQTNKSGQNVTTSGSYRQWTGKHYHATDYKIMYDKDENGNTPPPSTRPIWNSQGGKYHAGENVINKDFPDVLRGTVTLTLSQKSVNKIWDEGLVCVGMHFGHAIQNACSYTDGVKLVMDLWDVKLLQPEYKGDNRIEGKLYQDDPTVDQPEYFTQIMSEPMTADEANKEWLNNLNRNNPDTYRQLSYI